MPAKIFFLITVLLLATEHSYGLDNTVKDVELTFITPANMLSSYKDSPNSVTSLELEDLRLLGIDSFVDAMRLVPGMLVAETHGSSAAIGYHGTSVQIPRRMQILYNSNRLYRSGYADLVWQRMPIDMADLERIEIVRGTNITDYGTNAFTSTVNFIQKPAALETEGMVNIRTSSNDEQKIVVSFNGALGSSKGYVRAATIKSSGFDKSPQVKSFDDDYKGESVLYNGELELSNSLLLDWYVAGSNYEYDFPRYNYVTADSADNKVPVGRFEPDGVTSEKTLSTSIKVSGSNTSDSADTAWKMGLDVTNFDRAQPMIFCYAPLFYDPNLAELDQAENVQIEFADINLILGSSLKNGVAALDKSIISSLTARQNQLLMNLGQAIQRAGLAEVTNPLCAKTNQNLAENRFSLFAGFNRSTERFTVSSNLIARNDNVTSQTYLSGEHHRTSYEFSNNIRNQITDKLVLNIGVMAESNSDIDKVYYSPRVSLNFAINDQNIIRLLAADSNRQPGIHETNRKWQYTLNYLNGVTDYYGNTSGKTFRIAQTSDPLKPERLQAYELAYTFVTGREKTVVDLKLFHEKYSSLISEPFSYVPFTLTNSGAANVDGFEIGASKKLNRFKIGGGFSYIKNDTDTIEEKSLYSRLSGNAWMIAPLNQRVNLGLVYFGSENQAKNNYDRIDVNLNYSSKLTKTGFSLDLTFRHYPKDQATFTEYSSIDPFILGYNDRNVFFIKSQLIF